MANAYELGTSPHPPNASPSAGAKLGVFIVVIATIAAGAWFYISSRDSGVVTPEPVADSAAATPSPEPSASPPATLGATSATAAAKPGQPSDASQLASKPGTGRATRPRVTVAAVNDAPPVTPPPPAPPAQQAPVEPVRQPAAPSPAPERAIPASRPPVSWRDAPIYDRATDNVTPPSLLTPIGIAPVRTNYVPGLATIEVIVGGDGLVRSAKAGRPPATVGETLEMTNWLSAAKSWLFGPALRNGQPVNYRLIVPLSALVSGQGIR